MSKSKIFSSSFSSLSKSLFTSTQKKFFRTVKPFIFNHSNPADYIQNGKLDIKKYGSDKLNHLVEYIKKHPSKDLKYDGTHLTYDPDTAYIALGTEFEFHTTEQLQKIPPSPVTAISRAEFDSLQKFIKAKTIELKLSTNFFFNLGTFLVWTDDSKKYYNNEGFLIQAGTEGKDYGFIKYTSDRGDPVPEGGILNTEHNQTDNNMKLLNFNATEGKPNQLNCDVVVCSDIGSFINNHQDTPPKFVLFLASGGPLNNVKKQLSLNSIIVWADQKTHFEYVDTSHGDSYTEQVFGAKVVKVMQIEKPKPAENIISQFKTLLFGKKDNKDQPLEYITTNMTTEASSFDSKEDKIIGFNEINVEELATKVDIKK